MNFTIEQLEFFLLVVARISAFIYSAPIFSQNMIPRKVKAALSVLLAIITYPMLEYDKLEYIGVLGFALLVIKEILCGVIIGFTANICMMILGFAGNLIDVEMGFSMVQTMNPTASFETTITGNLLTYVVLLIMLLSNAHLYIIEAIIDTFKIIPAGSVNIPSNIYTAFVGFLVNYFVIAIRIFIPVFMCILVANVVLGILTRVSPQMNMFAVGFQIKIFAGLCILVVLAGSYAGISDFIFEQIKEVIRTMVNVLK
jgi:flagellar biosynthetic protein FliR